MVLVTTDRGLCPLLKNRVESGVSEILVSIAKWHFVDDIETQRVGQLIKTRFTRIVRCTDIVDGCLFHQSHITKDTGFVDNLYCHGIC